MGDFSTIREHMDVIGADGVHVGTVDKVEGDRIKLTKADSGQGGHEGHHHSRRGRRGLRSWRPSPGLVPSPGTGWRRRAGWRRQTAHSPSSVSVR